MRSGSALLALAHDDIAGLAQMAYGLQIDTEDIPVVAAVVHTSVFINPTYVVVFPIVAPGFWKTFPGG